MRASQEFLENRDTDDFFSRDQTDASSTLASAAGFPLDAAQENEAMSMKSDMPSGHHMEVKRRNEAADIDHVPFLNSFIYGVTKEETIDSEIPGKSTPIRCLEEMISPSNHVKSEANTHNPQKE